MLKKILKLTALGSSLLAIVGCSSAVDFSELTLGYDKAMEMTAEENILLNIVRSSKNRPLHFTAISGVSGSSYLSYGSASILAPFDQLLSLSRNGASFNTLNTPSFEQISSVGLSPLNTAEFLGGILNQISPKELTYYTAQGFPRELLFNLVIDSIEVSIDGNTKKVFNDPSRPDYSDFGDLLNSLLELGLSTETVSKLLPQGPVLTALEAADPNRIQINSASGFIIRKINNKKPDSYQAYATSSYSRFCFLPKIAKSNGIPSSMLCSLGDTDALIEDGSLKMGGASNKFRNASLKVTTRSTKRVFEYLGKLVYLQNKGEKVINLKSNSSKEYNYLNEGNKFFVVQKNNSKRDDIVSVTYDGDTYSIPKKGQGYSATVLGITFELLNLSKSVDSLPPPTTIRLQ